MGFYCKVACASISVITTASPARGVTLTMPTGKSCNSAVVPPYSRYGYRRIRALLAREGWSVSRKQVQRIRREEGLKVRPKPQRIPRQGVSTGLPTQATHRNHVWTWDFIFDRTDKGSTLKMLTMLDEYSRQCLAIRVERQIRSGQVLATLWQAMMTYGIPEHIRSDNGSEFIAQKIQEWLKESQIKTLYIDPGSPWQNGYIESFHSRFRDECLNREWLLNLREARVVIEDWRQYYNIERPHSRLGYLSPEGFIANQNTHTLIGPIFRSRSPSLQLWWKRECRSTGYRSSQGTTVLK